MLFSKPVSDFMTTDVTSVGPDTPLATIARMLDERRISAVPVVDRSGSILGVLSRTDVLRSVGSRLARIGRQASSR